MPIRPENRKRYPADWQAIRARIMARAGGRCECTDAAVAGDQLGNDGRCTRQHGEPIPGNTGQRTVLTVAHLDHVPEHCSDDNLAAWCQRCHLRYDAKHHAVTAAYTRDRKRGQLRLG